MEYGASRILAVDQTPVHVAALRKIVGELGIDGFTVIEDDLQSFPGHDETMDLVVLNDVLYTSNLAPDRVATVCARLLQPGGFVLFHNINRAYAPAAVSHRNGTQFLEPDSADRAARFANRGVASTFGHRPLSPWGLAAFLRSAGFDDFRLFAEMDGVYDGPPERQGLAVRYLLAGRKTGAGLRPFERVTSITGAVDRAPYCGAADKGSAIIDMCAERLRALFGGALTIEAASAELRRYATDRLLMDGLTSFRVDPSDALSTAFAEGTDRALDHSLAAVLTRHAGWTSAEFANADEKAFGRILDECVDAVRRDFQQPAEPTWLTAADWGGQARRVVRTLVPDHSPDAELCDRIGARLRRLVGDRLRLKAVELLARTADPLTGSLETEYAEAAIDRIACEVWSALGPIAHGPRPVSPEGLTKLVETIEAELGRTTGAN
jgi:hypothetical protein